MARSDPQFNVRMPSEIKERLTALAAENHRSINAEIIAAIQAWVDTGGGANNRIETISHVNKKLEEISKQLMRIEALKESGNGK